MTNGDKLRQLTDEELALWLTKLCVDYVMLFLEENPCIKGAINPTDEELRTISQSMLELVREEVQEDG